jgi:hypothetical protein
MVGGGRWKRAACDRAVLGGSQCVGEWWAWRRCVFQVRSRACVDAWADAASFGSFRDVAQVAVWGLRLMLHREQVD